MPACLLLVLNDVPGPVTPKNSQITVDLLSVGGSAVSGKLGRYAVPSKHLVGGI
jgi:hypothetical protein